MANNYMTTDDLDRLGIKWRERDGALVPADRVGLHPEADARLAAATGSGPATVYRIEASVANGPRFALAGTLAEIDARLRSGSVGVDVATGATGKASEWPAVAEKMRTEWAQTMASTLRIADSMTAAQFVDIARAAKPILVPAATWNGVPAPSEPVSTGVRFFDGTRLDPGDTVSVECDANGKWTAKVRGAAPGSYARAQAVDFTGAGATLTDGAAPRTKPVALAAGQVWEARDGTRRTIVEQSRAVLDFWRTEEGGEALVPGAWIISGEWRYLGTREEVAAREMGPSAVVNKIREADRAGMARGVAMGMSRTPLGTMTAAPAPAGPYRSAPAREPEPFALPSGAALDGVALAHYDMTRDGGETDEAFRARIVETLNDYRDRGTCPWFQRRIARALRVNPDAIRIDEPRPGVVRVAAWQCGVTLSHLDAVCASLRGEMPIGVTLEAWNGAKVADPLAALRAEIDALIAADSGPFAHARAAALRCYGEAIPSGLGEPIALRDVGRLHAALLRYESVRCGARTPAATHDARREAGLIEPAVLATYERERARSDVYARPARY